MKIEKIENALRRYVQGGYYPFHMPGHKRRTEFLPDLSEGGFASIDLTELDDTDDLHNPSGALLLSMQKAASTFAARKTYFSVGGSTTGILSAVHALAKRGDKVLVARNCHKSVYNAISLCGLQPVYVCPPRTKNFGFCGSVLPETVEKAFEENGDIRLVILTSPTYEGVVSDIAAIAKITRSNGAFLLVDAAHGAHLGFSDAFPPSAVGLGADVVVQSLHKTLPCFTQTALVHICTESAEICDIAAALQMYETSSPSYMLMCGIDHCVSLLALEEKRTALFENYTRRLDKFYAACADLKRLSVFLQDETVFSRDPSKLVISAKNTSINGRQLYYLLKDRYKLQLEMYTAQEVLAVTSICDSDEGFEKFAAALLEIDGEIAYVPDIQNYAELPLQKRILLPCEALNADKTAVPFESAAGKIAAGFAYAYPPGIPIFAPGEEISQELLQSITELKAAGVSIQGSAVCGDRINVIKLKKLL